MSHIRERWVYTTDPETGECVKFRVDPDAMREPEVRTQISMDRHYENTCTLEGIDIGSRRKANEYMRQNGLARPEDFRETWKKAAEQRAKFFTEGGDHQQRREEIGRAAYQLQQKRRR